MVNGAYAWFMRFCVVALLVGATVLVLGQTQQSFEVGVVFALVGSGGLCGFVVGVASQTRRYHTQKVKQPVR